MELEVLNLNISTNVALAYNGTGIWFLPLICTDFELSTIAFSFIF